MLVADMHGVVAMVQCTHVVNNPREMPGGTGLADHRLKCRGGSVFNDLRALLEAEELHGHSLRRREDLSCFRQSAVWLHEVYEAPETAP